MYVKLRLASKKLKGRYGYSYESLYRKIKAGKIDAFQSRSGWKDWYISWYDIPAYVRSGVKIKKENMYVNDEML